MADSSYTFILKQVHDDLGRSERSLTANARNSIAKGRRVSKDSIQQLEHIIATQQDRLAKLRHQPGQSLSHTRRLRASMKDSLVTCALTLQQIRQSADTLELIWAMFEYEGSTADS